MAIDNEARLLLAGINSKMADIESLMALGRFLSIWDCTAGLPATDPYTVPYEYKTGDYYLVGVTAGEEGTNYRPEGTAYTGNPSTTVELGEVAISDIYMFDGTVWSLLLNHAKTVSPANIIEIGQTGQLRPSEDLLPGGLFFRKVQV